MLEAPDGGNAICAGGLNLFVPDAQMSPSCLQYISYRGQNQVAIQQTNANAMLNGGLFALPAGDVKFAAGLSWRNEKYNDVIDHEASAGNLPGELSGPSTGGERDVQEYFGELNAPLLADLPWIKNLEADVGYRRSKYSGAKGVDSYSGNLTWDVNNLLTLRGGYSRAIRAPSLLDLHASGVQASLRLGAPSATGTGGDPCDVRSSFRLGPNGANLRTLCQALGVPAPAIDSYTSNAQTIFGQTHGNPSLQNEFSDTYTVGLVLNSPFSNPWLSGLRATFDGFDIRIEDAIGQLPLTQALAQCYNLDGVSNPSYSAAAPACAFFPRDTTGQITRLDVPLLNLAKYQTRGVDMQLDWALDLADAGLGEIGRFNFNLVETYLDSFVVQQTPTSSALDYVGTSQSPIDPNGRPSILPHWRSVATFTHTIGPFESSLRWRYVGAVDDASIVTNPTSTTPGAKAYNQVDGSFAWNVSADSELRFGVNNIGNAQPRILGGVIGTTDNQSYDAVGRTYYVALRHQF
ncbi:MAG: TonB-dependent receptor [Alphaproteobacteria bacterium]